MKSATRYAELDLMILSRWLDRDWTLHALRMRYGGHLAFIYYDENELVPEMISAFGGGDNEGVHMVRLMNNPVFMAGIADNPHDAFALLCEKLRGYETWSSDKILAWHRAQDNLGIEIRAIAECRARELSDGTKQRIAEWEKMQ